MCSRFIRFNINNVIVNSQHGFSIRQKAACHLSRRFSTTTFRRVDKLELKYESG
jgi:hypothetical protein